MKLSKYNIIREMPGNKVLILNTFSKGVVLLNQGDYKKVQCNEEIEKNLLEKMKCLKIICESDFDEQQLVESRDEKLILSLDNLNLTVLLTDDCNMRCSYCFRNTPQIKQFTYINDDMFSEMINWIDNRIKKTAPQFVNIVYLGGEPTLAMDRLIEMQSFLYRRSKQYNFEINSKIITNGVLISRENIMELFDYGQKFYQVTLDGPERIHNIRRPLLKGEDSYHKIIKNIDEIFKITGQPIHLRINIDYRNKDSIELLLDELVLYELKDKVEIIFARVFDTKEASNDEESIKDRYLSDAVDWIKACYQSSSNKGFKTISSFEDLLPTASFCEYYHMNSFTLDVKGQIYNCPQFAGNDKYRIGSVKKYDHFMDRKIDQTPLNRRSNGCKNCEFSPVCSGGCIYQSNEYYKQANRRFCDKNYFNACVDIVARKIEHSYFNNGVFIK